MTPNNPEIKIVPFPISPHLEEIIRQQKEIEEWVKNNVGISSDRIGEEKAPKIVPEDQREICEVCSGSGESVNPMVPCWKCKGTGEVIFKPKEYEPD